MRILCEFSKPIFNLSISLWFESFFYVRTQHGKMKARMHSEEHCYFFLIFPQYKNLRAISTQRTKEDILLTASPRAEAKVVLYLPGC